MRTETLWQQGRRTAHMHWWRQVLDRPAPAPWNEVLDEVVRRRFCATSEPPSGGEAEGVPTLLSF